MTYTRNKTSMDKPIVWLHGEVKTPPFTTAARLEAGYLLRQLQKGKKIAMPASRAMPSIGKRCHELRINDKEVTWRIVYRVDRDAVLILEVFIKKADKTPNPVIALCKQRIKNYDSIV